MSNTVNVTIDGKTFQAEKGQYLINAARENDIYIPSLCNVPGIPPRGSCRLCNVKSGGRYITSCTTKLEGDITIENDTPELNALRKKIVELIFVEGNHFCPSCEKSGDCELQALGYKYQMTVPSFPYRFEMRSVEPAGPYLVKDHNRCILCKRCIRGIKDSEGRNIFAVKNRGHKLEITIDHALAENISPETARQSMEVCPVGALLIHENAFRTPIGKRKYDHEAINTKTAPEPREVYYE